MDIAGDNEDVCFTSFSYISAVYGGLDIHGKQRSPVQSYLTATADVGDDQIAISHDSDWQVC